MPNKDNDLDDIDASLIALFRAMFHHRAWQHMQHAAHLDLERADATLLKAVAHSAQPCRLQDVARHLGIEAPSVSRTVSQLEQRRLLRRHSDAHDRRASNLAVTPRGQAMLKRLQQAKRQSLQHAVADWPSEERHELARLLHKLSAAYEQTYNTQKEKNV
jgi:DNA-binding MarR family transcriptional regulator